MDRVVRLKNSVHPHKVLFWTADVVLLKCYEILYKSQNIMSFY